MRDEIKDIRDVWDGDREAKLVADKTREIEFENQEFWQKYKNAEERNQVIMMKVFEYERELDIKIRDLVLRGKGREAALLANFVW